MQTKIIKSIESAFCIDDQYARDIIKLAAKSLVSDEAAGCTILDASRFRCEQIYYKYYGSQPRRLEYVVLPMIPLIVSANKPRWLLPCELDGIESAGSSAVKRFDIQMAFALASFSYERMLKNSKLELEMLTEGIKGMLIDCSERPAAPSEIIAFEKSRIYALQKVDRLGRKDREGISGKNPIDGLMSVLYQLFIEDYEETDAELLSLKRLFAGALGINMHPQSCGDDFIRSLCGYICRLREGLIRKEAFKETVCDPKRLVLLKEGECSEDPILGRICARTVSFDGDVLSIGLDTKSGEYVFKFKKKT